MKQGYIAIGNYGTKHMLTEAKKHPLGQLLEKCYRKHADKIYIDMLKDGIETAKHVGYIVAGEWFDIYELHDWNN